MMARDAHALVVNRILRLKKGSPQSHKAHREYQETRLWEVMPRLQKQRLLLESSLATGVNYDGQVSEIDAVVVDIWLELDSRIDEWKPLNPDASEERPGVVF